MCKPPIIRLVFVFFHVSSIFSAGLHRMVLKTSEMETSDHVDNSRYLVFVLTPSEKKVMSLPSWRVRVPKKSYRAHCLPLFFTSKSVGDVCFKHNLAKISIFRRIF